MVSDSSSLTPLSLSSFPVQPSTQTCLQHYDEPFSGDMSKVLIIFAYSTTLLSWPFTKEKVTEWWLTNICKMQWVHSSSNNPLQ